MYPRFPAKRAVLAAACLAGILFLQAFPSAADIYVYVDRDGVMHFTNTPTSDGYRLYMREGARRRSRRTYFSGRYDDHIRAAATKHGVAFELLKALIKAESDFNPKAVSKSGALGLTQLMPDNVRDLKVKDPFDPYQNIMGGARFFSRLLSRYGGRVQLALAAYHAGPGNVDRYGAIPPIPETEQYVKRVMGFYHSLKNGK